MGEIGIIICDRYRMWAGRKCFRASKERERSPNIYKGQEVEVVGYITCGGCSGGNIQYTPAEMKKNSADAICDEETHRKYN